MIDKSNEIFTLVKSALTKEFENITVIGESIDVPSKFPTVTIDEVSNLPTHWDDKSVNDYARVIYRVQVFTNGTGKRALARNIYKNVDKTLMGLNFSAKSYTTIPEIYNSKIYQITTTHEAVVKEDGTIYRSY